MPAKRNAKRSNAKRSNAKRNNAKRNNAKRPVGRDIARAGRRPVPPPPRLAPVPENRWTAPQRALVEAISAGPRGRFDNSGPFGLWLHAPRFGMPAQALGSYARLESRVPPRLSEFAILVTARLWRAHYEWYVHAPIAARAGVKAATIADLRAGRVPKSAAKDERAVYDFVRELYRTRRVGERTYQRLHRLLGDEAMVEFVGILGYYALVAMSLNVFRMLPPGDAPLPFGREP